MKRSFLTPGRWLAAVVLLLLVASLLPGSVAQGVASRPRWIVEALLGPVTGQFTSVAAALRSPQRLRMTPDPHRMSTEDLIEAYQQLQDELHRANQLIARYEYEMDRAAEVIEQLSRIRGQSGLQGVTLVSARVLAPPANLRVPVLTINQGADQGVQEGMAVVHAGEAGLSLVGQVVDAGPRSAGVKLITSESVELAVRVGPAPPDASPRQIEAWIRWDPEAQAFIAEVQANQGVQVGDVARLADDYWPREAQGFLVGLVSEVEPDPRDPLSMRRVVIRTTHELARLARVTVLVPAS
ncbi:MAG TPA: rod shape-determining protein MreC [Phycisphaeraceae bacterium]